MNETTNLTCQRRVDERPCKRRLSTAFIVLAFALTACGSGNGGDTSPAGDEPTDVKVEDTSSPTAEETSSVANEEAFAPTEDITLIIPYPPGGGGDAYSRAVADCMTQSEKVPDGVRVLPENMPPAARALGTVWNAEPDGYTFGYMPMPATVGIEITQPDEVPWNTGEFSPLGIIESNGYVLYVAADSKYQSIEDLQNASGLKTINTDPGSGAALASGAVVNGLGLDSTTAYGAGSAGDQLTALLRGEVDWLASGSQDFPGAVEEGDIVPLLFLGTEDQRPPELEWLQDLPNWEDHGKPELVGAVSEFRVFSAPPDTPKPELTFLRDLFWDVANSECMATWAESADRPLLPKDAADTQEVLERQIPAMREIVPELEL